MPWTNKLREKAEAEAQKDGAATAPGVHSGAPSEPADAPAVALVVPRGYDGELSPPASPVWLDVDGKPVPLTSAASGFTYMGEEPLRALCPICGAMARVDVPCPVDGFKAEG